MRIVGMIPARFKSTRFEGKPLADILGKPMIQHVYERSKLAGCLDDVLVATDDPRIFDAVIRFGGKAVMTGENHASGTDRLAEAASGMDADVVVNIQGDEPLIDPIMIEEVVAPFRIGTDAGMVTLKKPIRHESDFDNPNIVKVVADLAGRALYFSRSLLPYPRRRTPEFRVFQHIGLYAYTRECLLRLSSLPSSPLEQIESLEQLRALENGIRILVVETRCKSESAAVDAPEDIARVLELIKSNLGK